MIKFDFNIPKNPNKGEDANPIIDFATDKQRGFIFCSDGAGGAGSKLYNKENISVTGAQLASRTLNKICSLFNDDWKDDNLDLEQFDDLFKAKLKEEYETLRKEYNSSEVKIKSKLIKEFPATLALMLVERSENGFQINNIWAGDSRNYILSPNGLKQCTIDDLKTNYDPLENIRDDSPMSNLIHGDGEYILNKNSFSHPGNELIAFSCTDGCFGYYETPMHFELALLKTLDSSHSLEDFRNKLISEFENVSGDDFSMGFISIGFEDFLDIRSIMSRRLSELENLMNSINIIGQDIKQLATEHSKIESNLSQLKERKRNEEDNLWNEYKQTYLEI